MTSSNPITEAELLQAQSEINQMSKSLKLDPVYLDGHLPGADDKRVLINADEIIDSIISVGHPKALDFIKDMVEGVQQMLAENETMSLGEAKLYALSHLIEKAYGIVYEAEEATQDDEELAA